MQTVGLNCTLYLFEAFISWSTGKLGVRDCILFQLKPVYSLNGVSEMENLFTKGLGIPGKGLSPVAVIENYKVQIKWAINWEYAISPSPYIKNKSQKHYQINFTLVFIDNT